MKKRNWIIALLGVMMSVFLLLGACTGGSEKQLTLSKSELQITQYTTQQLDAFLDGEKVTDSVEWSSSNESVCTVEKGLVTARKGGVATVTAKSGEKTASCEVAVEKVDDLPSITLTQTSVEIRMGTDITVGASATFKGDAITPKYTWSSADEKIATVDQNGKITGVSYGYTTVTVKAEYMGAISEASVNVKIKTEFDIIYSDYSLELKTDVNVDPEAVNYALSPKIYKEGEAYTGDTTITYSIDDESVATVSGSGLVSAVKAGKTRVVAQIAVENYLLIEYLNVTVEKSRKVFDLQDYEMYRGISNGVLQSNRFVSDVRLYDDEWATITIQRGASEPEESSAIRVGDEFIVSSSVIGVKTYGEVVLTISLENVDFVYPLNVITRRISTLDDLKNLSVYGGVDDTNDPKYQYSGYFVLTKNIDCNYETLGERKGYHKDDVNVNLRDYGFDGIFDGRGYCIENMVSDDGGLFGNAQQTSVIKNLAVTGRITNKAAGLLGKKINGTLENIYIKTTVVAGLERTASIASFLGNAKLKDVVVVADASNAIDATGNGASNYSLHGYLAFQVAYPSVKDGQQYITSWTLPTISNVHVFVKNNDNATTKAALSTLYAPLYPDSVKKGITEHGYNDKVDVTMTDDTYWTTFEGQPIFKSAPKAGVETLAQPYEVYSSINSDTPVANELEINLTKYALGSIDKITLISEKATTAVTDYEFKNGVLTISGTVFGANIYGDTSLLIESAGLQISYQMTVVTKYINTLDDMKNLAIYGGIDPNDSTGAYAYDGYFLLTKTLDNNNAPYTRAENFKYSTTEVNSSNIYGDTYGGFVGIFDGQGYSLKNIAITTANSGGIFGYVDKTGVVKNLGVTGSLRSTNSNSFNYMLAHGFLGTLQNCYIQINETNASGELQRFSAIAANTTYMRATDVVIKFDGSRAASPAYNANNVLTGGAGFIANTVCYCTSNGPVQYRGTTFKNVHAFVKDPTDGEALLASNGYDILLKNAGVYGTAEENKLTKHAYNATASVTMTDSTHWDMTGAQPIFRSAK